MFNSLIVEFKGNSFYWYFQPISPLPSTDIYFLGEIIYMFTQSCDFSVSVIQNEVKDLVNVSCEVPARDPSLRSGWQKSLGKLLYYLILVAVDLSIRRKRVWGFNRLRLIFNRLIYAHPCLNVYNLCTIYVQFIGLTPLETSAFRCWNCIFLFPLLFSVFFCGLYK